MWRPEARRAALDAGGFGSSAALDSALATASQEGSEAAKTAEAGLKEAEERWKHILQGLEAEANTELKTPLRIGQPGPDFRLQSSFGKPISLGDLLAQGPSSVLLIWLRHFG